MLPPNVFYEQLPDIELFQLTRQDDTKAFEILYMRHWSSLIDTAYRRLQSREKAEDMVQEIFISFYQKRQFLEITVSVQAYLYQALKYKILNEFRSENIRISYQKSLFLKDVCKNDFANEIDAKDLNKKIDNILASLPEKCRRVFILSRHGNKTNKDISQDLKISVSTVEKHIGKALKTIKFLLPEYRLSH
jgi:RNA polymerase sigma-70 factor (family 1)